MYSHVDFQNIFPEKVNTHTLHKYGFSPVWFHRYVLKREFAEKTDLQTLQECDFSPECYHVAFEIATHGKC